MIALDSELTREIRGVWGPADYRSAPPW